MHKSYLGTLTEIEGKSIRCKKCTLLNPFDNFFWCKKRLKSVFGFAQILEAYKPENQRVFGYYTLSILLDSTFVGRICPKLDRVTNTISFDIVQLGMGAKLSKNDCTRIAKTLVDFSRFHNAQKIDLRDSSGFENFSLIEDLINNY